MRGGMFMLRKALFSIVVGVAALALGTSPSQAVEIDLGSFDAQAVTNGCTHQVAGNPGSVCGATFTINGTAAGNLTATAFNGNPNTAPGTAFITYKSILAFQGAAANGLSESGLGENTAATGGCSNPTCEIEDSHSVAIQSSIPLSVADVRVGSAQTVTGGEGFVLWTGSSLATLAIVGTFVPGVNITCPADLCEVNFGAATVVAIQSNGVGDVLLTSVSPVPEPATMFLGGLGLVAFGYAARRRLFGK